VWISLFSTPLTLTCLPIMSGDTGAMYWYGCEMYLLWIIGW
jgi:hypothetical protein